LETKILGAEDRILEIEARLFNELVMNAMDYLSIIQTNARVVARLDVLLCFTVVITVPNSDSTDVYKVTE
jgi:DNA mismatch repair protein MutS